MAGTDRSEATSDLSSGLTAALEKLRFTDEESDAVINLSASEIGGVVRAIRPVVEELIAEAIHDSARGKSTFKQRMKDWQEGYDEGYSAGSNFG